MLPLPLVQPPPAGCGEGSTPTHALLPSDHRKFGTHQSLTLAAAPLTPLPNRQVTVKEASGGSISIGFSDRNFKQGRHPG